MKVAAHVQEQLTEPGPRRPTPRLRLEMLGTAAFEVGNWTPFGQPVSSPGARERHRERTIAEPLHRRWMRLGSRLFLVFGHHLFAHLRETPPTSPPVRFIQNSHKG